MSTHGIKIKGSNSREWYFLEKKTVDLNRMPRSHINVEEGIGSMEVILWTPHDHAHKYT